MSFNILVVDDEADIRELVSGILMDNGYETATAGSYVEADALIKTKRPNLAILDVWLGENDRDGLRILDLIKKDYEYVPVVMISGHGTIETAITAVKQGAYDFIEKPFTSSRLIASVEKAIEAAQLQKENAELKVKAKVADGILGNSENTQKIKVLIKRIAPMKGSCAILGAPGSDKEIIAREIHKVSLRSKSPFGVLNCCAYDLKQLRLELLGSEITTYEHTQTSIGILEKLNGGTLFIDEIAFSSSEFQQIILDTLKRSSFRRVGSDKIIPLDIRIIAGLPLDIENLVKDKKFNSELYYRLTTNVIKILPLSSRKEDIPYLLEYYLAQATKAHNVAARQFSNDALNYLQTYPWFGDVLQLKNMIDWVLTTMLSENKEKTVIEFADLPKEMIESTQDETNSAQFISTISGLTLRNAREIFEREYFIEQLKKFDGNISQIAKFVSMERTALHRKLKLLGIEDCDSYRKHG